MITWLKYNGEYLNADEIIGWKPIGQELRIVINLRGNKILNLTLSAFDFTRISEQLEHIRDYPLIELDKVQYSEILTDMNL